jgi:hemoglobin/transferrin/lactoferrin receptor protein
VSDALTDVSVDASVSYARGEDQLRDMPLNSVDPTRAVVGVSWRPEGRTWAVEAIARGAARKTRVDEAVAGSAFRSPGYAVIDVHVQYRFGEHLRLHLSGLNLGDRKYWDWGNVRGRSATDPAMDRYTNPGRSLAATLIAEF